MGTARGWEFPPDDDLEEAEDKVAASEALARQGSLSSAARFIAPVLQLIAGKQQLPVTSLSLQARVNYVASKVYVTAGSVYRQLAGEAHLTQGSTDTIPRYLDGADELLERAADAGRDALYGTAHASAETRRRAEIQYAEVDREIGRLALARFILNGDVRSRAVGREHLNSARLRFEEQGDTIGYVDSRTLELLIDAYAFSHPWTRFPGRIVWSGLRLWEDVWRVTAADPEHAQAARQLAAQRFKLLFVRRRVLERALLLDY